MTKEIDISTILKKEFKDRFVPFMEANGYVWGKALPSMLKTQGGSFYYGLGVFQRSLGEKTEFVYFEKDRRGSARYKICFRESFKSGIQVPYRDISSDSSADYLYDQPFNGALYKSASAMRPFGERLFRQSSEGSIEKSITQAIKLMPEIELWFTHKIVGPHLRVSEFFANGLTVHFGRRHWVLFRTIDVAGGGRTPNNFTTYDDKKNFIRDQYKRQNRKSGLGKHWLWKKIYTA